MTSQPSSWTQGLQKGVRPLVCEPLDTCTTHRVVRVLLRLLPRRAMGIVLDLVLVRDAEAGWQSDCVPGPRATA